MERSAEQSVLTVRAYEFQCDSLRDSYTDHPSSVSLLYADMPIVSQTHVPLTLGPAMSLKPSRKERLDRLQGHMRRSRAITPELLTEVIAEACIRFAAHGSTAKAGIRQLAEHGAWMDAVLSLLELELPHWRLRRLLYEDGEWHCFLSRRLEIPLELDDGVEATHEVVALAILIAFIKARSVVATAAARQVRAALSDAVCCDNFA